MQNERDIPVNYRNTPIETLLTYHNLMIHSGRYEKAELLIIMCMDNRLMLKTPDNFAYVIRNSGARIKGVSFAVSFAIAVAGIRHLAVIGHSDCKMVDLESKKDAFISGLSKHCGWKNHKARKHFSKMSPHFNKTNAVDSVISEVKFIRSQYPGIIVAPVFYSLDDNKLNVIKEQDKKLCRSLK